MITRPGSLREAATLVEQKAISPVALTRACLDRIAAGNETLRAFITVMDEQAMADAARAEKEIAKNRYRGPLHGIPVSVKDLVDIAGTPTTSGSAVPPRRPQHDATIVSRLRAAGAIIVGKTNLHEFAYGTTTDETAFGAVRNPYDHSRSAGGSSAGAAVAIVEEMCYGSIGGHRRLDPDPGGGVRHHRPEADPRRDPGGRRRPPQHDVRSRRADGADGIRHRAALSGVARSGGEMERRARRSTGAALARGADAILLRQAR